MLCYTVNRILVMIYYIKLLMIFDFTVNSIIMYTKLTIPIKIYNSYYEICTKNVESQKSLWYNILKRSYKMEKEHSDRILEIFYRLLHGELVSNKAVADEYGISSKSVSRDIGRINNFLAEHRDIMQNAEVVYSHKDRAYILKSDEFLKNKELFAIVEIILGSRCFNKEDMLNIVSKLKKFTTANDRKLLDDIIRKEVYHYHEVKSDCDSVIENLWKLIQCIDNNKVITITYLKMDRSEVVRKIKPAAIMFSEYYFYLIAYPEDDDTYKAKYFRIDRIRSIVEHREKFRLDREHSFDEGNLREKNQFMFPGDNIKITFEFSGLSLQAILDRLPTAKVIEQNGSCSIISAEVNYGRGIIMYLLSQGSWVKVLEPKPLVEDMKAEIEKMRERYSEQ